MLWVARVEDVSERKQAVESVVNDRFWVAIRATLLRKYSKYTIGFASVVHYQFFLYKRVDKSEPDKSALFRFHSISFF